MRQFFPDFINDESDTPNLYSIPQIDVDMSDFDGILQDLEFLRKPPNNDFDKILKCVENDQYSEEEMPTLVCCYKNNYEYNIITHHIYISDILR